MDFTGSVIKARNKVLPNGTINDVGIRGRMIFDVTIEDCVAVLSEKRFFKILLEANANLDGITCDVTLPHTLANLIDARMGSQNMRKVLPYRVDAYINLIPTEPTETSLYFEWEMPEPLPPTPWYEIFPWKFIIPGLIGVILTVIFRDAIPRFFSYLRKRRER